MFITLGSLPSKIDDRIINERLSTTLVFKFITLNFESRPINKIYNDLCILNACFCYLNFRL